MWRRKRKVQYHSSDEAILFSHDPDSAEQISARQTDMYLLKCLKDSESPSEQCVVFLLVGLWL